MKLIHPMKSMIAVPLTITGEPECVDRVLAILGMIHLFSSWGHSGTFGIAWDGDGSDKVEIQGSAFDPTMYKDLAEATSNHGGDIEIVGADRTAFSGKFAETPKKVFPPKS